MATCKGRKKDGTPCKSPIVLHNGYCRAHQDQATQATAPEEPVRWTRKRLETGAVPMECQRGWIWTTPNVSY